MTRTEAQERHEEAKQVASAEYDRTGVVSTRAMARVCASVVHVLVAEGVPAEEVCGEFRAAIEQARLELAGGGTQ